MKCLSSLVYLHPAVSLWMCWVGGQAGLKEGVVTGEDKQVGACMCGTSWAVVSLANLVIHQTESIHRPHHSLYLQPLCSPPTQGPSVRLSAKPGISTLISHLWHPNELRLLLHLWDPTDYQTGGDHLSMARGGIYTADLAAKERGNKMVEKAEERERREKKLHTLGIISIHANNRVLHRYLNVHLSVSGEA